LGVMNQASIASRTPHWTQRYYFFFVGAGDGVSTVDVGTAAGAVAD